MSKVVLGKGLGALIPGDEVSSSESEQTSYRKVSLDEIAPNPMQPRREFDSESLNHLAESFRQNGMLQPLVVRSNSSGYVIIAGERRYRAARIAELNEVPVVVMDDVDDARMLELALVENLHRQDLNPIDTAQAYRRLVAECGLTQDRLATRVGKSRAAVANQLRLLSLPSTIQEMVRDGKLTEGHARAILSLRTEAEMVSMARRIVANSLTVREVEQQTSKKRRGRSLPRRQSPAVAEMELQLKRTLGTSVKITPGRKRGKITIEFYGENDLDRLWELLRRINRE